MGEVVATDEAVVDDAYDRGLERARDLAERTLDGDPADAGGVYEPTGDDHPRAEWVSTAIEAAAVMAGPAFRAGRSSSRGSRAASAGTRSASRP